MLIYKLAWESNGLFLSVAHVGVLDGSSIKEEDRKDKSSMLSN